MRSLQEGAQSLQQEEKFAWQNRLVKNRPLLGETGFGRGSVMGPAMITGGGSDISVAE